MVASKSFKIVMLQSKIPMPSSRLGMAEASSLPSAITETRIASIFCDKFSLSSPLLIILEWNNEEKDKGRININ